MQDRNWTQTNHGGIHTHVMTWVMLVPLIFLGTEGYITGVPEAGSPAGKLGLLAFNWAVISFCIGRAGVGLISKLLNVKFILFLPLLAMLSTFWSQDPVRTIFKALCLFLMSAFAAYLVSKYDDQEILFLFFTVGFFLVVASIVVSVGAPSVGVDHTSHAGAWRGIFPTKNDASRVILFLLPSALCYEPRSQPGRLIRYAHIFLSLLFIALTRSVAGIFITILSLCLFYLVKLMRRTAARERLVLTTSILAAAGIFGVLVYAYAEQLLPLIGRSVTLTGRTTIWASILLSIAKRPWFGYGHGAFWIGRGEAINTDLAANWDVSYAHNGYLDVVLQLGFVGLFLLLVLLVQSTFLLFRSIRRGISSYTIWCMAVLFLTVVFNLDETTFILEERIYWLLFLVAAVSLQKKLKEAAVDREPPQVVPAAVGATAP